MRRSEDNPKEEGRGRGKGTGWAKGLLIRGISEESPISNIKDESDRSCHCYDFLVHLWNELNFFQTFLNFILHLGLIMTPMFSMFT